MKKSHRPARKGVKSAHSRDVVSASPALEMPQLSWRKFCLYLLLVVTAGLAALPAYWPSVQYLFSRTSDEVVLATEDLDRGAVKHDDTETSGDVLRTEFGLANGNGSKWRVTWNGDLEPGALPLVRVHAFTASGIKSRLIFTLGESTAVLPITSNLNGNLIVAQALKPGPSSYSVAFESEAEPGANPALVLDRIIIGSRIFPNGELQANFYVVSWVALSPLLLLLILSMMGVSERRILFTVATASAILVIFAYLAPVVIAAVYVIAVLLCVVQLGLRNRDVTQPTPVYWDWIAGFCFAALVLPFRWHFFIQNALIPLLPDAADYMQIAARMEHPYDGSYREPVFLWLIKLWLGLTTWSPLMLRALTLLISYLQTVILWRCSRLFLSPPLAFAVVAVSVFNPALIASSVQGLREEIFPAALLLHMYLGIQLLRNPRQLFFWGFVIVSGVLPLIRLNALIYVVITVGLVMWQLRASWQRIAYAAVVIITLLAPLAIYQTARFGEPFYSANSYVATFYRNIEFKDQPGFPSSADIAANAWAGKPVSMGEYVFGLHSVSDVTSKTLNGVYNLLIGPDARSEMFRLNPKVWVDYQGWAMLPKAPPHAAEVLLVVLFVLGLAYAFLVRHGWFLLVVLVCIQLPLSFLVGSDLLHWRLTMNGIPFMLIVCGLGIEAIFYVVRRLNQRTTQA